MLSKIIEQGARLALKFEPSRSLRVFNNVPASVVNALARARLSHTMRLVAERSPVYREQFQRRGIDVRRIEHPSELGDFYTTGEDLRARAEDFIIGRAGTAFETTGTTSPVPKRVFFSQREIEEMGHASAIGLAALGLRRTDKVLSAFDCSFWVSPAVLRSALRYTGCFHVEAGKIDPLEFYERASFYRPNVIFGEPSWIMRLTAIVAQRGGWAVKFLFAGGENIAETARTTVEETWKAPLYLNYGQTESFGAIGIECREKTGYHCNDVDFIFEIADSDETECGELVYTTLTRDVMPLIRYRSADLTQLIGGPCPCGFFPRRIAKIRARTDEMVVCGMGNVGPWVFEEILRGVERVGDEWQAVLSNNGRFDVFDLRIEARDLSQGDEVETIVMRQLRE